MTIATPSEAAIIAAARDSYGKLVAWLAWQWRDLNAAEDALSSAFLKALEIWPANGIPDNPQAWLLTVAKRELLQIARHKRMRDDPTLLAILTPEEFQPEIPDIPDTRLRLMLVCAHPAIDPTIRSALMLQTVLALQAKDIACAMLLSPSALTQRLVRVKQKIRDTNINFEEPATEDLAPRLQFVLEAIYAVYGLQWELLPGSENEVSDLTTEAVYLAELICALQPDSAEANGLLALLLFCEARRAARRDEAGKFIPLLEQDIHRWNKTMIFRANKILWHAATLKKTGHFQLEAAIQSAHCQRLFSGSIPQAAIVQLYQQLYQQYPTVGAQVAYAVVLMESGDIQQAHLLLQRVPSAIQKHYQPWWVAQANLLTIQGEIEAAKLAYQTAIGLSIQPAIRDFLVRKQLSLP